VEIPVLLVIPNFETHCPRHSGNLQGEVVLVPSSFFRRVRSAIARSLGRGLNFSATSRCGPFSPRERLHHRSPVPSDERTTPSPPGASHEDSLQGIASLSWGLKCKRRGDTRLIRCWIALRTAPEEGSWDQHNLTLEITESPRTMRFEIGTTRRTESPSKPRGGDPCSRTEILEAQVVCPDCKKLARRGRNKLPLSMRQTELKKFVP